MSNSSDSWEKFLDPEVLRPSLFSATLFITTFEVLKNSIIDRIRNFYCIGMVEGEAQTDPTYRLKVLERHRSPLYASLNWLLEHGAITEADLETFERLKRTRNLIAHQLLEVVTGQVPSEHQSELDTLVGLLRKIEVWWIVEVEIATDPDYDGKEIDEEKIVPGSILSLQMLIEVASGNTELLEFWRREQKKKQGRKTH